MTYVYLLSVYGEHGAEDVTATLDRENLRSMVRLNWSKESVEWIEEAEAGLSKLLENSDEELVTGGGMGCMNGWGGVQLYVVKLI